MAKESVYLMMVTGENNNKFYNMVDNGDGTFTATYGRVDVTRTTKIYHIGKWNSKLNEKKRRGYRDITNFKKEVPESPQSSSTLDIENPTVRKLIARLQDLARGSLSRAYTISSEKVTRAMVDEAQDIIDEIARLVMSDADYREVNKVLLDLYHVIPRRMGNVRDHLLIGNGDMPRAQRIVTIEQDNIDTMGQQVSSHARGDDEGGEVLENMGIEVAPATSDDMEFVRMMATNDARRVSETYRVENKKTRQRYDDFLRSLDGVRGDGSKSLWHGSRNQNWLSILESGLLVRPSGVVTTGSAFGNGIYFADELIKSIGYTSVRGSYWASGSDSFGFCAIFDVYVGKPLVLNTGDWSLSLDKVLRQGYDSTFGRKGTRLSRNEYIVYRPGQATIKYLVQIK